MICISKNLLLISFIILINSQRCTDKPSCFIKTLFDFSFPKQDLYKVSLTDGNEQYTMKAYGDFNNDLAYLILHSEQIISSSTPILKYKYICIRFLRLASNSALQLFHRVANLIAFIYVRISLFR
jgi:hypothetical protein